MQIMTERIVNISDLEQMITRAYRLSKVLRDESKKENPSKQTLDEFSEALVRSLHDAVNFDLRIDRRLTNCVPCPYIQGNPEEADNQDASRSETVQIQAASDAQVF